MTMQTKQATTGVVALVRPWSGTGASAFGASRGHTGQIVGGAAFASPLLYVFEMTPNHGTDLSPASTVLGTTAWSPPV